MEKITVKNKPWINLVYAILCLIVGASFTWVGIFYIGIPELDEPVKDLTYWLATAFLWFSTLLFWLLTISMLCGVFYFFRAAFDSKPTIVFDEEGISSKYFYAEKIYWNEIAEVQVVENETIVLKLNNENKYLAEVQSSKFLKTLPHLAFNLSFVGATMNANEALEIINQKTSLELKQ